MDTYGRPIAAERLRLAAQRTAKPLVVQSTQVLAMTTSEPLVQRFSTEGESMRAARREQVVTPCSLP